MRIMLDTNLNEEEPILLDNLYQKRILFHQKPDRELINNRRVAIMKDSAGEVE